MSRKEQLSNIPRRASNRSLHAGVPVRTLQEFSQPAPVGSRPARQAPGDRPRQRHAGPHAVGIFDETSDVEGDKTPGVQQQCWCARWAKLHRLVHLAYARDGFHCTLRRQIVPARGPGPTTAHGAAKMASRRRRFTGPSGKSPWNSTTRAGPPTACADWTTFDEGYGSKPSSCAKLSARDRKFVECCSNFLWAGSSRRGS